jgi:hypothetical protein|tara:strand:- start:139 stop:696 length:558 start_codon:yes stop_codon:yes gene_type:complete
MASTISTVGFDSAFPVAGVDNDSQGFRTNFNVTKVGLEAAASEITTLQSDTAKLNASNAFNGSVISEAEFTANTETVNPVGNLTAGQDIDWAAGHYQTLQAGADISLTLTNWPAAGVMGKLRMQLTSDGSSRVITWESTGGGSFKGNGVFNGSTTLASTTNPTIIDFWTINGGLTVHVIDHGVFD